MAGGLTLLVMCCMLTPVAKSYPTLHHQIIPFGIISCNHENVWKYGSFCIKLPLRNNTMPFNPAPPCSPTPSPVPSSPGDTANEEPESPPVSEELPVTPPESSTTPEGPPVSTTTSGSETTLIPLEPNEAVMSNVKQVGTHNQFDVEVKRPPRNLHFGPEFSLSLPPLVPPLSLNVPSLRPSQPPPTVIVQVPSAGS